MKYYDWEKTFSYDADITLIIGGRGIGKTYGMRLANVRQYLKTGERFVEVCRYQREIKDIGEGYFDRIDRNEEFPGYVFKFEKDRFYIAEKPVENEKPSWETIGYIVGLTSQQSLKKRTFDNVRRIVMDEAVLERADKYHKYLPNEYVTFANLISTILREDPDTPTRGRVYLLGNACDLLNPYLQNLGVDHAPKFGYSWFRSKTVLLHYVEPVDVESKVSNTLVGRMLAGTDEAEKMFNNAFSDAGFDYVEDKPKNAQFRYGIVFQDMRFGVWVDWAKNRFYVNRQIANDPHALIYALTTRDNKIDYQMAKRTEEQLKFLMEMYYSGCVYYDSPTTRETFMMVLSFFGIR